jgi:hypothetical protein
MQAFTICLRQAANKLDDHTSDPSAIAGKASEACKREWIASSPTEEGMSGARLAEYRASADKAKKDLAVEAVLEERAAKAQIPKARRK